MQLISNARRLSRVLNPSFLLSNLENSHQWRNLTTLPDTTYQIRSPNYSLMARVSYTSEATLPQEETAKEIYDKMLKSVEGYIPPKKEGQTNTPTSQKKKKGQTIFGSAEQQTPEPTAPAKRKGQTMPPNKLLWGLVEKCTTRDDIALLFHMLQTLRTFRMSYLRIHDNFNCTLCTKVAEACARVGAIDYGKKALWEHNKYGLTPSVSSAHHLLLLAKKNNDSKLMVEIMKLLKRNHLPLQPGTADIVFSICSNTNDWELISKYANKFIKAGVKLRRTTFGTWMEFAAKRGDVESILKIENLRSTAMEKHNLATAFSCAKGFLLQGKPENAAAIIHVLNEKLPDEKKKGIATEIQKLVSEWPLEVIHHQRDEDKKKFGISLERNIPAMINGLVNMGLKVEVNLDDLKEAIPT